MYYTSVTLRLVSISCRYYIWQRVIIGGSFGLPMWLTDGLLVTFLGRWRGAVYILVSSCGATFRLYLRMYIRNMWNVAKYPNVWDM